MIKKINLRFVRYFLFFVWIIILWYAGQIFVQNFNMQKTIESLKEKQIQLSWDTYWLKNYYKPFLKTKYAKEFFSHKNWIPLENEVMIKLVSYQQNQLTWQQEVINLKVQKNNISWQNFFSSITKKIWLNF